MPVRKHEKIRLKLEGESIDFDISIASGENAILPFNLHMDDLLLKKAALQPVTRLTISGSKCWFFMVPEGMEPCMVFDAGTVRSVSGLAAEHQGRELLLHPRVTDVAEFTVNDQHIIVMTRAQAMRFAHITKDGQTIAILSDSGIIWDGIQAKLESEGKPQAVLTMPSMKKSSLKTGPFGGRMFGESIVSVPEVIPEQVGPSRWCVRIPAELLSGHKTVLLRVSYMGNIGQAFINGEMISDNFCNGSVWDIRLDSWREQLADHPLTIYIVPVKEGVSVSVDSAMAARMEHVSGVIASLDRLSVILLDDVPVVLG